MPMPPRVRPRFLPRVGEKFQLRHLQPLAREAYERLAELTGKSVDELLPLRLPNKYKGLLATMKTWGAYNRETHGIMQPSMFHWRELPRLHKTVKTYLHAGGGSSVGQHEALHGIFTLLHQEKSDSIPLEVEHILTNTGQRRGFRGETKTTRDLSPFLEAEKFASQARNEVYEHYGIDGILALIVNADKINHADDITKIPRQLKKRGLLEKNGLTERGKKAFEKEYTTKITAWLELVRRKRTENREQIWGRDGR